MKRSRPNRRPLVPIRPSTGVPAWQYEDTLPPNHRPTVNVELRRPDTPAPAKPNVFQRFFGWLFAPTKRAPTVRATKKTYQAQGNQGPGNGGGA